jgi:K+/H+ antiporter YhaU regulatory subunit KhtT
LQGEWLQSATILLLLGLFFFVLGKWGLPPEAEEKQEKDREWLEHNYRSLLRRCLCDEQALSKSEVTAGALQLLESHGRQTLYLMVRVGVEAGREFEGKTIAQVAMSLAGRVLGVIRDGQILDPTNSLRLQAGDTLITSTDRRF